MGGGVFLQQNSFTHVHLTRVKNILSAELYCAVFHTGGKVRADETSGTCSHTNQREHRRAKC